MSSQKPRKLRALVFASDVGGCWTYRIRIPYDAMYQFGFEWSYYTFLPVELSNPNSFQTLVNMVSRYDIIVIQRCYLRSVAEKVIQAGRLLGIPVIFETDDDYLSIIPSNPAYFAIVPDQGLFSTLNSLQNSAMQAQQEGRMQDVNRINFKIQEMIPQLMASRKQGEEDYKWILKNVDGVTTSTKELSWTMTQYNKNVRVFENNVQFSYPYRLDAPESAFIAEENGVKQVKIHNRLGLYTIPKFAILEHSIKGIKANEIKKTPRVGYSCTASHYGEDINTIVDGLNNVAKRLQNKAWYVFLGDNDRRFSNLITGDPGRVLMIPGGDYQFYMQNMGNFDIALAPLAPTVFNLSKSDIKLVEAGSWGAAPLAPRYTTYSRNFKENENCLMYSNEREFEEKLELLITRSDIREEIGRNALKYVVENRISTLEQCSRPRYEFFRELAGNTPRLRIYKPQGDK